MASSLPRPSALPRRSLDRPAPFLKWAGGKTQLLGEILPRLPAQIETYYEPFIGGGAVFFALAAEGRFARAVLSDRNVELIEAYTTVRDHVGALIAELSEHQRFATDSEYFYALRATPTETLSPIERSARLIFLNKTCFNGLYRVNRKGQFNVPFGRYVRPRVLREDALLAASRALQGVTLLVSDFGAAVAKAKAGDAVYFDPPYVPVSSSASFTAYHRSPFGPPEHQRLTQIYQNLQRRGVASLLSNSDTPETRSLYRNLEVETVRASRAINSKGGRRGAINELLVTGLKPDATRQADLKTPREALKA